MVSQLAYTMFITITLYGKMPNILKILRTWLYISGTNGASLRSLFECKRDWASAFPWKTFFLLIKFYIQNDSILMLHD